VLGGARCGKSRYAEALVASQDPPWVYIATAEPLDAEMRERIDAHQARRDARWRTLEAPRALSAALRAAAAPGTCVLVDCVTLWLSNLLLAQADVERETSLLIETLTQLTGPVVVVSNEVGGGIVPDNALARRFRDAQGRVNVRLAEVADRVTLLVAGLPVMLK
jgi:adenosylcobinamide kinase/adenosylcobinamide-phosphate guanylyltransferase